MTTSPSHYRAVDRLVVEIHPDRMAMAAAAARAAAAAIQAAIADRGHARVIFGCAPSQDDVLAALLDTSVCGGEIRWEKVTAFHMDDYVGLDGDHPQSFRYYLREHLLNHVRMRAFHALPAESSNLADACANYTRLLAAAPIDLICMGIGENGHIAFNDPPVAEFDDPAWVKVVELDPLCRRQQVNDGCFERIEAVPRRALTLTVPVFRRARRLSVHVPGPRKAEAVAQALHGPISAACPASILRTHPDATLYLDSAAASLLPS